jgi:RNA polymerase sigma-70 factor (ECF subfamily)
VQELPKFRHSGRHGAFRSYLRQITLFRLQAFWRSRGNRPAAPGGGAADSVLLQLEDPASELSFLWDQEHDQFVMRRLLELIEPEFGPTAWKAFMRQVFDRAEPIKIAEELGIDVANVYLAKSRILKRLRQEGRGLLD